MACNSALSNKVSGWNSLRFGVFKIQRSLLHDFTTIKVNIAVAMVVVMLLYISPLAICADMGIANIRVSNGTWRARVVVAVYSASQHT